MVASKPGNDSIRNAYDYAVMVLFVGIVAIFIFTFRDYGYSWDEVTQNRWYGQAVLRFIQTFGEDLSALYTNNFYYYGGLFDAIAELIPYISPLDGFGARRFANASMGLIALVGAWKTARLLAGPQAGFWALLFLVTTPVWYGHIFINAKDIPFAAGYIWSLYFIIKTVKALPDIPKGTAVGLGVAFGLAIGIRVGGGLVIVYFFMMIGLYLSALLVNSHRQRTLESAIKRIFPKALLSLFIAWIMMVAFWPKVLILPIYFVVKLPIPILLMFIVGLVWASTYIIQQTRLRNWSSIAGRGLLIFAILFPLVYAISTGAIVYDGIRHFLFIIPPMACLAGVAMAELIPMIGKRFRPVPLMIYGALGAYLVVHVWVMIQLHPYQYTYLNRLAGGIPEAAEKYETDYWITSYREATLKVINLAKDYARSEGVPFAERRFEIVVFGDVNIVKELVPENIVVSKLGQAERADFYISSTRMGYDKKLPDWPVVERVGRMGMTFTVIKTSLPAMTQSNK